MCLEIESEMPDGLLEVVIAGAAGLEDSDFFSGIDAYAVLSCNDQEKRSKVASGQGATPVWNETFLFNVSGGADELKIKILDKDMLTCDDFLGEAIIQLRGVFDEGSVRSTTYSLIKDGNFCGGVTATLKFTRQRTREISAEDIGGWRSSSFE